ncbi:class I SAM-dependent methyltransferase [Paenibacillus larvae]|nr:class I SAM-dependent methyltransferase [Paenibacillus larvae]MDT2285148.1 class I SAM-dependent methyltransferase [Paenibacillus larvae]
MSQRAVMWMKWTGCCGRANPFKVMSCWMSRRDAASSDKQLQMRNIWEAVAEETSEALNDYGWSSSYGGKAFSLEEMQEYIGNFQTKLKPHLTKESKVLEVGCGHGLLLFHLAPDVKEYVATDLSGTIIERNRERAREGLSHVKLSRRPPRRSGV